MKINENENENENDVAQEPSFPSTGFKNSEDGSSRLLCNIAIHLQNYNNVYS